MKLVFPDVTGALCAKMDRGLSGQDAVNGMVAVFETGQYASATGNCTKQIWGGVSGTLNCMHDQQAVIHEGNPPRKYIVRRLTPTECCRLQGFPDWWTDGVEGSDSAKYKMWGNGIALPCAFDVLRRIAEEYDN